MSNNSYRLRESSRSNGCGERCWRHPRGIELNEHEWRFGVEQPGRMKTYGGGMRCWLGA